MCTESEAKHANREEKKNPVYDGMAPRVKFLSFLIVQLSLFRTVGLLLKKKRKEKFKKKV